MRVLELWRYPVKSVGGEQVSSIEVTETGLAFDRGWGIVDLATGNVLTARRAPDLLFASAAVDDGDVVITLPDGSVAADDAALSAWLGADVSLRRAGDEGGTYENPMDVENDADWMSWTGPGGAWHDSGKSRVSLVTTASLGAWDQRRFRANVVLDGSGEDALVGQQISAGTAVLDVTKQIARCVMVTRPQPGLDRDLDVLKTINRERDNKLTVGATVNRPGRLSVGDEIEPLS